jgi:hypothetical protein
MVKKIRTKKDKWRMENIQGNYVMMDTQLMH